MRITVVIPTFNRRHTLERAIGSVLEQSRGADEIIVVDDGSTDGTSELLQRNFPEIQLIQQPNRGVSAARNQGILHASGEWIAFLDSDDAWLPHKLSMQAQLLQAHPEIRLCHTEELWIRNGRRVNAMKKHRKRGGWIYLDCLPLCVISPSSVMIHRQVFDRIGLFDESLPACEDYDLWLRICARYETIFVEEPCITKYGGHDDQLSGKYWGMDRFRIAALERMMEQDELSAAHRLETARMLVTKCRVFAKGADKHGNAENALKYYDKASRYQEIINGF